MSAEYSVGQILAAAEAAENGDVRHPGMIADMLRELARIKADDAVDGRIDFKGMWNDMSDRTTTRPPAPAEQVDDGKILWGIAANAGRVSIFRRPRWAHVSDATGQGSTSAAALCRRFGFDPDEITGDQLQPDPDDAPTAEPVAQGDADELFNTFRLAYYGSNKSLAPELESFRRAYRAIATHPHSPDAADGGRVDNEGLAEYLLQIEVAEYTETGRLPGDVREVLRRAAAALAAQAGGGK